MIGLTYSPKDVVEKGGTIVFRSSNIQNGMIDYSDLVRVTKPIKERIITKEKDILICARNGSQRLIGKNTLLTESDAGNTFGAFMMVYRSDDNDIIHPLLSTKRYISQVAENLGARINQITTSDLNSFEFFLPQESEERRKIGELFALINERIATQNKIIDNLKSLIKGLRELFFNASYSSYISLGEIAELYQPKTISTSDLEETGYLVYGANGIIGHYHAYNHELPQICITCRGNTCGQVTLTVPNSWITGNAMVVNIDGNKDINQSFLFHFLSSYNYSSIISGSGQPQIVRSPLAKIKVPNLDLKDQNKISRILDSVTSKVELEKNILSHLELQKKHLVNLIFI